MKVSIFIAATFSAAAMASGMSLQIARCTMSSWLTSKLFPTPTPMLLPKLTTSKRGSATGVGVIRVAMPDIPLKTLSTAMRDLELLKGNAADKRGKLQACINIVYMYVDMRNFRIQRRKYGL